MYVSSRILIWISCVLIKCLPLYIMKWIGLLMSVTLLQWKLINLLRPWNTCKVELEISYHFHLHLLISIIFSPPPPPPHFYCCPFSSSSFLLFSLLLLLIFYCFPSSSSSSTSSSFLLFSLEKAKRPKSDHNT